MSNIRPGKTLKIVIDDAYCACDIWEIRLAKFDEPTLDSLAALCPTEARESGGMKAITSAELRSHYRKHFNIPEAPIPVEEDGEDEPRLAADDYDDDDDGWGDEYLEDDQENPSDRAPRFAPTDEEYDAWKLEILALIKARYDKIKAVMNE